MYLGNGTSRYLGAVRCGERVEEGGAGFQAVAAGLRETRAVRDRDRGGAVSAHVAEFGDCGARAEGARG